VDARRRRRARAALGRERKRRRKREQRALSVEVKTHLAPSPVLMEPWSHAPRIARSACINCRRVALSLASRAHHDRSSRARTRAIITTQQPKSRGEPSRPPAHVAHYARGCGA
jgi:hypothetical protein